MNTNFDVSTSFKKQVTGGGDDPVFTSFEKKFCQVALYHCRKIEKQDLPDFMVDSLGDSFILRTELMCMKDSTKTKILKTSLEETMDHLREMYTNKKVRDNTAIKHFCATLGFTFK